MSFQKKTPTTIDDLKDFIKTHAPALYFSSQTSTVIPYDKLESRLAWNEKSPFTLVDLSQLPAKISLTSENHLQISGAVSWQEAQSFCHTHGRLIMTSPTEQLALVTAGVATSCTGERCFGYGTLREQIISLTYINFEGEIKKLNSADQFSGIDGLMEYQNDYQHYKNFKNAPFPRFQKATDLMVGTEGQLGIVTEVILKTAPNDAITYMFILLPPWEENYQPHQEILENVQNLRSYIYSCEILDSHCMDYLKEEDRLGKNQDVIFLEINSEYIDIVQEKLISQLKLTTESSFFEISKNKFHHIRAAVPRAIFEKNSQMGVVKMGTDVQVTLNHFSDLLDFYKQATQAKVPYCLFGHFGDAHLHFNFLPNFDELNICENIFKDLYLKVVKWKGSPFAEHGVGLLKKDYIKLFYQQNQLKLFSQLKKNHDPYNQFFPQGFMNAKL